MVQRRFNRGRVGNRGRFRRRRSGGAWFPTTGNQWNFSEGIYQSASFSGQTSSVDDHRAYGPTQNVFPITRDLTQFTDTSVQLEGPSLRDIVEGQTWRLNRIVGQLHVDCTEQNSEVHNDAWPCIEVAAGFFVARSGDSDPTLPDLTFDEIDPLQARNAQNSWIWRRTWILSRPLASNVGFTAIPCTNSWMSGESGTFIDSRVKRNVLREHRLWFVIGCMGWSGANESRTATTHQQPYMRFNLDVRLHGMMKRARSGATF